MISQMGESGLSLSVSLSLSLYFFPSVPLAFSFSNLPCLPFAETTNFLIELLFFAGDFLELQKKKRRK